MESINQPKNKNYFFRDNSNDYNNIMTIQYRSDTKDAENYHNQVFFYERSKTQDPGRKIKEDSFLPKEARPKKIVSLMDDNDYFNREKENIINDNDFSKLLLNSKVGFKNNGYLCYINSIRTNTSSYSYSYIYNTIQKRNTKKFLWKNDNRKYIQIM